MSAVEGLLKRVLRTKPTVVTRAFLWKIRHNTAREDIRLKIGRYKKSGWFDVPEEVENTQPKSELTLDHEEFQALIGFLQESYEPFKQGVKAFIPLDRPFDPSNAEQIKALFSLPAKADLVRFILNNEIIPDELEEGLRQARRVRAVKELRAMLDADLVEQRWQKWFEQNSWVLGSDFVRILDERRIDARNISDFLMEAYDGFLDVVEIKRPGGGMQFWAATLDHGNSVPSTDLIRAITQSSRYLHEIELEANSDKFIASVGGVKTVKPRCVLVFGRSVDWTGEQCEAYRILNASFHNINILTYDHVLARAERIVDIGERSAAHLTRPVGAVALTSHRDDGVGTTWSTCDGKDGRVQAMRQKGRSPVKPHHSNVRVRAAASVLRQRACKKFERAQCDLANSLRPTHYVDRRRHINRASAPRSRRPAPARRGWSARSPTRSRSRRPRCGCRCSRSPRARPRRGGCRGPARWW
ncbi:uncharacterized protein DUF4263 [Xylophilus ampelinus]|uniref:Uncharacterized protein DUF4263 n=1 Tax=Xylophilus ampelinus TaxID=54067 RepID=A0A318SDI4_9BURK|nr:uncharacterized protein DUF4263 [Xylophilus ampelinus]